MSYFSSIKVRVRDRLAGSALVENEAGLSTVEYVIILVLIAAISIGTWKTFGGDVKQGLEKAQTAFGKGVGEADTTVP